MAIEVILFCWQIIARHWSYIYRFAYKFACAQAQQDQAQLNHLQYLFHTMTTVSHNFLRTSSTIIAGCNLFCTLGGLPALTY